MDRLAIHERLAAHSAPVADPNHVPCSKPDPPLNG
jgi:hypothetical protein